MNVTPPYRAAIIGIGFIGAGDQVSGDAIGQQVSSLDGTHLEALRHHPRVQVVAGMSRDAGRRERFTQRTGCKAYSDWRKLLEAEKPDIVSVANRAPEHAEVAVGCAERGVKAIYCEKPVAPTLAEAEQILAACAKGKVLLAFNHNRRFNPNYRRLRDLIAAGKLGDLTTASLRWPNGRMGNVATHMIDALCMVTGRKVLGVSGTLDLSGKPDCRGPEFHDPGAFGWMRMEKGLMASVDAADYARGPGEMVINGTLGRALTGAKDVTLKFWDGTGESWPAPTGSAMDRAVAEIVDALDGKAPFPYDPAEAVHTLEAIVAFHASHARNSAWVALPLQGADRAITVHTA